MKKLIFLVIVFFLILILMNFPEVLGQSVQMDTTTHKETHHEPIPKKVTFRTEISKQFDAPNGIGLIHDPTSRTETSFNFTKGKYNFTATGEVATSVKKFDAYANFSLGVMRHFKNFNLAAQAKTYFGNHYKFAVLDTEVSKLINVAEETHFRPFTKLSFYTPLETGHSHVSKGIVWSTGTQFEGKLKNTLLDLKAQAWLDSGSIKSGQRIGLNGEALWLVPIPKTHGRLNFGPGIEIIEFVKGAHASHLDKRTVTNFKLSFVAF